MADSGGSVARRTVVGASWLVGWQMITRGLGFISTLVLARLLVPADFGLVAMAVTFAGAVNAMSQLSVDEVLVRRVENDTRLYDVAFTVQVGRAVLTGGLILLGARAAAAWFSEPRLFPVLLVVAALTMVDGFQNIGMVAYKRDLRFDMQFRVLLVPRLLQLVVTITVAWFTRSYWALLIGMATTRLTRVAMTYGVHPYRPRFALRGWRELIGFSFWLWAVSLVRLIWDRFDAFVVGPKFGSASLGAYQVGAEVALLPVSELLAPATEVLLAGMSLAQRSGSRAVERALPLALALVLLLAPMALAISAGAGDIVRVLLGAKWVAAQPLISVFAWTGLLAPFGFVFRAALVVDGQVRREFGVVAVSAAIKVVALWMAAQTHDLAFVAGAAVACVAVETTIYMTQMGAFGGFWDRRTSGGFVRVALGGAVAWLALRQTGIGWASPVLAPGGGGSPGIYAAMFHIILLGLTAVASCWATVALLWLIVGRPAGPEAILTRLAGQVLRPCTAWIRHRA